MSEWVARLIQQCANLPPQGPPQRPDQPLPSTTSDLESHNHVSEGAGEKVDGLKFAHSGALTPRGQSKPSTEPMPNVTSSESPPEVSAPQGNSQPTCKIRLRMPSRRTVPLPQRSRLSSQLTAALDKPSTLSPTPPQQLEAAAATFPSPETPPTFTRSDSAVPSLDGDHDIDLDEPSQKESIGGQRPAAKPSNSHEIDPAFLTQEKFIDVEAPVPTSPSPNAPQNTARSGTLGVTLAAMWSGDDEIDLPFMTKEELMSLTKPTAKPSKSHEIDPAFLTQEEFVNVEAPAPTLGEARKNSAQESGLGIYARLTQGFMKGRKVAQVTNHGSSSAYNLKTRQIRARHWATA